MKIRAFSNEDVLDPTIVINYSAIDALRRGVAKFRAEKAERESTGDVVRRPARCKRTGPRRRRFRHVAVIARNR